MQESLEEARSAHQTLVKELLSKQKCGRHVVAAAGGRNRFRTGGDRYEQALEDLKQAMLDTPGAVTEVATHQQQQQAHPKRHKAALHAAGRYERAVQRLKAISIETPGAVLVDDATGAATIRPINTNIASNTPSSASSSTVPSPISLLPLRTLSTPMKKSPKSGVSWTERDSFYEAKTREREERSKARRLQRETRHERVRTAVLTSPPYPIAAAATPEDTPLVEFDSPRNLFFKSIEDVVREEERDREAVATEELVRMLKIEQSDPQEIVSLAQELSRKRSWQLLMEAEREKEAKREDEHRAEQLRWETVREAVWEESTVRGFFLSDEMELRQEILEARNLHSFEDDPYILLNKEANCSREEIQIEFLTSLTNLRLSSITQVEHNARHTIESDFTKGVEGFKTVYLNSLKFAMNAIEEASSRARNVRQESIAHAMLLSEAGSSLLKLVNRMQWLTNCAEVDSRFQVETEEEVQWKEVTYNHPVSFSVVRWTLKVMSEQSEKNCLSLSTEAFDDGELIAGLEGEHRETIYELFSHSVAMMHREAQNRKRSAIAEAISLAKETQEQLKAAGVSTPRTKQPLKHASKTGVKKSAGLPTAGKRGTTAAKKKSSRKG